MLALTLTALLVQATGLIAPGERVADAVDVTGRYSVTFGASAERGSGAVATPYRFLNGERVVATGELAFRPEHAMVSATGLGFAALGFLGREQQLALISTAGEAGATLRVLAPSELWPAPVVEQMFRTGALGTLDWWAGWWIDEPRHELILISHGPFGTAAEGLRAVSFRTGRVRPGSLEDLGLGLLAQEPLLLEFCTVEFAAITKWLEARMEDEREAMGLRVRAATALAVLGRNAGRRVLLALHAAGEHELLAEHVQPFLVAVLRTGAERWRRYPMLVDLGEVALPAWEEVLGDDEDDTRLTFLLTSRFEHTEMTKAYVPLLLAIAEKKDGRVGELALTQAGRLLPYAVHPVALEALKQGRLLGAVAAHFSAHRYADAVPVLRSVLARPELGDRERELLTRALAFQTED